MAGKSLYRICKDCWQALPIGLRHKLRRNPLASRLVGKVAHSTIGSAKHQEIYDKEYYRIVEEAALEASPRMADTLVSIFSPKDWIDVGCGTGSLLSEIVARGVNARGLEYSEEGLRLCLDKGLNVASFDLEIETPLPFSIRFDAVSSFEVAEHLPESMADRFVDFLCSLADTVVMSAATPGQGGVDHVNEQPHEYWIAKFEHCGFQLDRETTERLRLDWQEFKLAWWFPANVMVFRKANLAKSTA